MQALKSALVSLVAAEARIQDLVDPDVLRQAASLAIKECAFAIDRLHGRLTELEAQVEAMSTPTEPPPAQQTAEDTPAQPAADVPAIPAASGLDQLEGAQVQVLSDGVTVYPQGKPE